MTSSVEPSTARPLHYFKKSTKILLDLQAHVDKMEVFFGKVARQTNGVLTYYYRIDPSVSDKVDGFWYVDANGNGFVEHEVTDITQYYINDTTQLVWYTIPRASQEAVWLPPVYHG